MQCSGGDEENNNDDNDGDGDDDDEISPLHLQCNTVILYFSSVVAQELMK